MNQEELKRIVRYEDGKLISILASGRAVVGKAIGSKRPDGYVRCQINGHSAYLHRLVWLYHYGELPEFIDHINGDRSDNRIENLRASSLQENNTNLRKAKRTSKSGVLGVNWHKKTNKWRVQVRLNRATIHVGYFDCIEKASAAYIAKKRELHPACTI